ncbi:MAG: hypothetical protein IT473_13565 [Lysobacter sp.]|nr:hypothetical protein [Lysobacter sp.]
MGAGPAGLAYFVAVKLAGYTAMAYYLRKKYPQSTASPWVVGATRTLIGLGAGIGLVFLTERIGIVTPSFAFYGVMLPLRIAEWLLVLWLFYERPDWRWSRALRWASLGYVVSCLLDAPAVLSMFVLPGGVWVC